MPYTLISMTENKHISTLNTASILFLNRTNTDLAVSSSVYLYGLDPAICLISGPGLDSVA